MINSKKRYISWQQRNYGNYCKYCHSCGESGCCSALICVNHPKGLYCQDYRLEMRKSHKTLNLLWSWLYENEERFSEVIDKLNEIEDTCQ